MSAATVGASARQNGFDVMIASIPLLFVMRTAHDRAGTRHIPPDDAPTETGRQMRRTDRIKALSVHGHA